MSKCNGMTLVCYGGMPYERHCTEVPTHEDADGNFWCPECARECGIDLVHELSDHPERDRSALELAARVTIQPIDAGTVAELAALFGIEMEVAK